MIIDNYFDQQLSDSKGLFGTVERGFRHLVHASVWRYNVVMVHDNMINKKIILFKTNKFVVRGVFSSMKEAR